MGEFYAASGIVEGSVPATLAALASFAKAHAHEPETFDAHGGVIIASGTRLTVNYSDLFIGADAVSAHLSRELGQAVFSFAFFDGDFWQYRLYLAGEEVDRFSTVPDYFEEMTPAELASWQGNAEVVARCVPGLDPAAIARYLVRWDMADEDPQKAYPTDTHQAHDCWQLVDFMRTLGFTYPVDDAGEPVGDPIPFELAPDAK